MTRTELMRQLRRQRVDVQERGDELKMNCPVCGDQRGRLFFNTVLQRGHCQNECGGFSSKRFYETFGIVDLDAASRSDVAELLERELEPEPGTAKRKGPIGAPFPISSAVLVEGVFDYYALEGNLPVLATFGTSLSESQLQRLLMAGVDDVTLLWDGDSAGQDAAERTAKRIQPQVHVRIAELPEDKDPDQLPASQGRPSWLA